MSTPSWQERWQDKLCTAADAVRRIRRGRRILIGSGAAEPAALVEALCVHGEHLADNDIVHVMTLGPAPYVAPEMRGRFRHTALFIGANVREAIHDGRADFMPVFLSEVPRLIRSRRLGIDVALIQVSPPDEHGFVSLGVAVDVVRAAVDTADLILAEVNPRMPRTLGNSFLHVDRIDRLVAVDTPLPELRVRPMDETSREIGRRVAGLVPDRAVLQAGIGTIPDAVLAALSDRGDLGVHTEMCSDGLMHLAREGVITGRYKEVLPGKIVTSFVMGSRELYAWVHDNPLIEMRPSEFTNDPEMIARHGRMIAINSALAVDLTGQVASDTLMGRFFSGIGGQVDFIRGAARSEGGRAIIALPSTARGGSISRIQPAFEEGAGVVTSRGDVRYVVTEYGVADLWGKSIRQRAMSLIEIAHPDFRSELLAHAKRRRYVFADQIEPSALVPWAEARRERLPDGQAVVVRPLRMSDEELLRDLFYDLSDESTYKRFMAYKKVHPHDEMQRLVALDYEKSVGVLACIEEDGFEHFVAMARYDVDAATNLADVAFIVRDEWQGKGVGSLLMRRMTEIARSRGVAGFSADVLANNRPMLSVLRKSGLALEITDRAGICRVVARIDPRAGAEVSPKDRRARTPA